MIREPTIEIDDWNLHLHFQLVSKISTMFEELLEGKRSLEATVKGAAHIDPEVVARLTNTVYRAYKFYEDHQKSWNAQKKMQDENIANILKGISHASQSTSNKADHSCTKLLSTTYQIVCTR